MDNSSDIVADPPGTRRGRKFFTVDEAQRALALVRRVVADIVAEYPHLLELQEMLEGLQQVGPITEIRQLQHQIAASVSKLQGYAAELDEIGVEIRDFTRGVVDFSAIQDGREVKLCWRFGEPQIRHWHEVGAGVGDRKLIGRYRPAARAAPRKLERS